LQAVQASWAPIGDLNTRLENERIALADAETDQANAEEKLKKAQDKDQNANADLLTLLQTAKKYISEKDAINACPVCDNGLEKETVVKSLAGKIDSMEVIKTLSESHCCGKSYRCYQGSTLPGNIGQA
jgi:DNA repair exonuclease SbcCD ATPase subunit